MTLLLYGGGLLAAGAVAWFFSRPKPAPFHVHGVPKVVIKAKGLNIFPLLRFMNHIMPDSMRQKASAKNTAPKPNEVKDRYVFYYLCSFASVRVDGFAYICPRIDLRMYNRANTRYLCVYRFRVRIACICTQTREIDAGSLRVNVVI